MNVEQFKDNLVQIASPRARKAREVCREVVDGLLPGTLSGEVKQKHAEAYEVDGTTVVLSKFISGAPKRIVLMNFETGEMFVQQL